MAGKATVLAPTSSATRRDSRWQLASSSDRSTDFAYTGPTVWITHLAGRRPAEVATAWPVGRPSGYRSDLIRLHSSRISGPPLRWMAPSTPPPPISEEFAAFTMASTSCCVMSPFTSSTFMPVMVPSPAIVWPGGAPSSEFLERPLPVRTMSPRPWHPTAPDAREHAARSSPPPATHVAPAPPAAAPVAGPGGRGGRCVHGCGGGMARKPVRPGPRAAGRGEHDRPNGASDRNTHRDPVSVGAGRSVPGGPGGTPTRRSGAGAHQHRLPGHHHVPGQRYPRLVREGPPAEASRGPVAIPGFRWDVRVVHRQPRHPDMVRDRLDRSAERHRVEEGPGDRGPVRCLRRPLPLPRRQDGAAAPAGPRHRRPVEGLGHQ